MSNYFKNDHPFIGHQWWLSVVEGGHHWSKYDLGWPLKSFSRPPVILYIIRPNYHDHNDRWVLWMFYNSVSRVYAPDYTFHSMMISNEQMDVEQSALNIAVISLQFWRYGKRTFDSIVRFHNVHFISCLCLSSISWWVFEGICKPFPICWTENRAVSKYRRVNITWKQQIENQITNLHFHDAQAMKFCSSTVKASPFRAQISRLLISAQVDRRFEIRFWNLSKTIFSSFGVKLYWSEDETSFCISVVFSTVLVVFSSINFILNWLCGISYSGLAALPSFETFSGYMTTA